LRAHLDPAASEAVQAEAVWTELKDKYHVFMLHKTYIDDADLDAAVIRKFGQLLGPENVLHVPDPKAVVDVMLGAIAVVNGRRTMADYMVDMDTRGQTAERKDHVTTALSALTAAGHAAPPPAAAEDGGEMERLAAELAKAKAEIAALKGETPPGRYRKCAGAIVFNPRGLVMLCERNDKKGQYQFPQGGFEPGEDTLAAATRELYEETGLSPSDDSGLQHVAVIDTPSRYNVPPGTWLEKQGFVGQEMTWALYRWPSDILPPVRLTGLGGEAAEFTHAKWATWEETLSGMVEFKREVYVQLAAAATPLIDERNAR